MCVGHVGMLYVIGIYGPNISKEYSDGIFGLNISELYLYISEAKYSIVLLGESV